MTITGYYYIRNDNRHLRLTDIESLPTLKSHYSGWYWPFDNEDRSTKWVIIIESFDRNAEEDSVIQLVRDWGCTARELVSFIKTGKINSSHICGIHRFLYHVAGWNMDESRMFTLWFLGAE